MRRALGLILPILVAASGCLSSGPFAPTVDPGPPNGNQERTLEYWGKLRGALSQRSKSDDLRALTNVVQKQIDVIHSLPTDGVDPELVAAAQALAKCQETVIELAEIADFQLAGIRATPAVAKQFIQANQQAGAARARLAQLHSRLSARYGVAFVAFER
jgi:hypothetical protein